MPNRPSLRPRLHAVVAGSVLCVALTAGCRSTEGAAQPAADATADPYLAQEFGQLDIGLTSVELGIGLARTTESGTVQSRFTARSVDGGITRVLGLSLEFWIDSDADGEADENERSTVLGRREPGGTDLLTIPFEVPYEKGRPLRFIATVDTTVGSRTIPGDFALP